MILAVMLSFPVGIFAYFTPLTIEKPVQPRTVYYLPYAMYYVNATGRRNQSKQWVFIGTVKSTRCDFKKRFGYRGQIQSQFSEHIEGYYKSSLGVRHSLAERIGYWRFDTPAQLVGMRARIARRYPNVISVPDFVWYCR